MQSPFSNGGSPTADGLTETRFTYVPAVTAGGDGSAGQVVEPVANTAAGIPQVNAGGGKTDMFTGGTNPSLTDVSISMNTLVHWSCVWIMHQCIVFPGAH